MRRRLLESKELFRAVGRSRPFMAVTPLGLESRTRLLRLIKSLGVEIAGYWEVPDWASQSSLLYTKSIRLSRIVRAITYEKAWLKKYRDSRGEIWLLRNIRDFRRLVAAKARLRDALGSSGFDVMVDELGVRKVVEVKFHPFHVPDERDLAREWGILMGYGECNGAACHVSELPVPPSVLY